jgi:hypothetical protein
LLYIVLEIEKGPIHPPSWSIDPFNVSIEEQLAMFMKFVGHRWTNRSVAFEFLRSEETVSRYFNAVLDALCTLSRDVITMRTTKTHPKISNSPERFHPYFKVTYTYVIRI